VALVGFGGMGKSLLAEEYAYSFGPAYPGGIYAVAGDESVLLDHLADCCRGARAQPSGPSRAGPCPDTACGFLPRREYTVGVEEELMLLDPETLALAAAIEPIIADEHERGPAKRELMQCQAELNTRPCRNAAELLGELVDLRAASIGSEFERRTVRSTVETMMLVCRPTWICSEPEKDPSPRVRMNVPAFR
jgi:Glutamate-cysteine ligase family 2(GCS2)